MYITRILTLTFESFVNLYAAHHAKEFHPALLARDCGVSQPTIKSWAKILEACYLAIFVPPYFENFGKRVIKTPKFYFTDPSLVCLFTRQPAPESVLRGNMGGSVFEGLIMTEIWKAFLNRGKNPRSFSGGHRAVLRWTRSSRPGTSSGP
jgi:hypothetical protein